MKIRLAESYVGIHKNRVCTETSIDKMVFKIVDTERPTLGTTMFEYRYRTYYIINNNGVINSDFPQQVAIRLIFGVHVIMLCGISIVR